jgi:hypothetical protein
MVGDDVDAIVEFVKDSISGIVRAPPGRWPASICRRVVQLKM